MYANDTGEVVLYAPPKSLAFGHQARIRDPRIAWPAISKFLDDFALYRLDPYVRFDCCGLGESMGHAVASERIEVARRLFGTEKNSAADPRHTRVWQLQPEQLPDAIAFSLDDDKWPKQNHGAVSLFFRYQILWREFLKRPPVSRDDLLRLPLTDDWSFLGVFLGGRRAFLQPHLVFPFHYCSDELAAFLRRIEETLPFQFRDQYFKRWLRSKNGGYGRVLKLDKLWRQPNLGLQRTPSSGRR
jgi:hypothetical protein